MKRRVPTELASFLLPYPPVVVELVYRLRSRVLSVIPQSHEVVWDATNAVSMIYAPSPGWHDAVCHIATYADHVTLGFNDGASLPDPQHLLLGSGGRIRHARLTSVHQVEEDWVEEYIVAALSQAGLDSDMGDGATTVRRADKPTRRPDSQG